MRSNSFHQVKFISGWGEAEMEWNEYGSVLEISIHTFRTCGQD
jgi:hypothetical protein